MNELQLKALVDGINAELAKGLNKNAELVEQRMKQLRDEMQAAMAEAERKFAAFKVPGTEDATHKGQPFSFGKFYRAIWTGDWRDAPLEKEVTDAATPKVRAMGVVPDSTGGFAVPTEVMVAQMIPLLYAKSIVANLGATQLTGLTAIPIAIPKQTGGSTAYWLNEHGTLTASQLTFGQVRMQPRILATVSVWSELLNVSQPAIENMIQQDQARKMALEIDRAAIKGAGGSEPLGLVNWGSVATESISGAPTYDKLVNMTDDVEGSNALEGNLGWAMSVAMKTLLRKVKDAQGSTSNANVQPLGNRELFNDTAKTLLGYKHAATTALASTDLIFGNWADLVLGQWGGMMVTASSEVGFLNGQRHLRTMGFFDSVVRHGESFSVGT